MTHEKEVQKLIARYPWLLDLNYERVSELDRSGMEHSTPSGLRVDLILRHRITNRPVLVEFKAVSLSRETIGQILEYRAQSAIEIVEGTSPAAKVFGTLLVSPILVLVVPNCTGEARIACNLAGIDVYEYESATKTLLAPSARLQLDEMARSLNKTALPVTNDRHLKVQEISKGILTAMEKLGLQDYFIDFKIPKGSYYWSLANFFVNKWLFSELTVSIGVYENVFKHRYDKIAVDYCSENKDSLNRFRDKLIENKAFTKVPKIWNEDDEYFVTFYENKDDFINRPSVFEKYLKAYVGIMKAEIEGKSAI